MSGTAVPIRRARHDDAAALTRLLRSLDGFDWLREEPEADTLARVARHLALALGLDGDSDSHSVYVAVEADGELAGYIAVHWLPYYILRGPEGFVSELFLRPDRRGRGLGGRLLAVVVAEARRRGCARLSLLNSNARESYQRGFYHKQGWEERPYMANFILRLD